MLKSAQICIDYGFKIKTADEEIFVFVLLRTGGR